ncbi:hypothetical protein [Anaerosalibacter massiliensis]|uniref:hypothetical protein n=1 Tax=Anaerosalibacter massiliensis TaxID=1347392 RepID=UPI00164D86A7|nr:hypothetical protein [Anaerosalibacter massiliensis]
MSTKVKENSEDICLLGGLRADTVCLDNLKVTSEINHLILKDMVSRGDKNETN